MKRKGIKQCWVREMQNEKKRETDGDVKTAIHMYCGLSPSACFNDDTGLSCVTGILISKPTTEKRPKSQLKHSWKNHLLDYTSPHQWRSKKNHGEEKKKCGLWKEKENDEINRNHLRERDVNRLVRAVE